MWSFLTHFYRPDGRTRLRFRVSLQFREMRLCSAHWEVGDTLRTNQDNLQQREEWKITLD